MKKIILVVCLSMSLNVFAFMCPKSYQTVQIGDTEQQVMAKCGAPTSREESKKYLEEDVTLDVYNYSARKYANFSEGGKRETRPAMTFVFKGEELVTLNVGGIAMNNISICNTSFSVNESTKSGVWAACGKPNFITTQNQAMPKGRATVGTWVYQFNQYQPANVVNFENGKVISIR